MGVVQIEILGRVYALTSDRPPEHLQAVSAFVDRRLREIAGGRPDTVRRDHAILAALNIASELFLLRDSGEKLAESLDARLCEVMELIEQTIDRDEEEGAGGSSGSSSPPNGARPS
ncbi:MAG TPA: hypothetical protein DIU15_11335 [Deltaproteobacteria bacterium]|nr:hypothetical protein [Deltaproteobacteria bacterium]HCP46631.1 hypothetical protein [Deltaproteobacteria bacterium]